MPEFAFTLCCVTVAGLTLVASCAAGGTPSWSRAELLQVLVREMEANTGWVRVHAAEALLDHGQNGTVVESLSREATAGGAASRVGVWRVLSRAVTNESARLRYQEQIRHVMLDPQATDRLHAAESLAKLGLGERADRKALLEWLETADAATMPFVLWLLCLSGDDKERASHEAMLVRLPDTPEPVARLRAAVALGRLPALSAGGVEALVRQVDAEPKNSPARPYLVAAALNHAATTGRATARLQEIWLHDLATGKPHEQLEGARTLGRHGQEKVIPLLERLLESSEPDARIGAASALLHLRK